MRGDRITKKREAFVLGFRGVFASARDLKRLRFTINAAEHPPRSINRCATVFTPISLLKRGILVSHLLNRVAQFRGKSSGSSSEEKRVIRFDEEFAKVRLVSPSFYKVIAE